MKHTATLVLLATAAVLASSPQSGPGGALPGAPCNGEIPTIPELELTQPGGVNTLTAESDYKGWVDGAPNTNSCKFKLELDIEKERGNGIWDRKGGPAAAIKTLAAGAAPKTWTLSGTHSPADAGTYRASAKITSQEQVPNGGAPWELEDGDWSDEVTVD